MLRVSDGSWSTDKVVRIIETGTSDFTNAIGQTVTGSTLVLLLLLQRLLNLEK